MKKKLPRLYRWSYSLWAQMQKCPKSVFYGKIMKITQPPVPAMVRGEKIHKEAEGYLKGEIKTLPKSLSKLADEYKALKKMKPEYIEQFMSLGRNFKPVKDGLRHGWFTLKADAICAPRKGISFGFDHKTGRVYDSHDAQAELTAMIGEKWFPGGSDEYVVEFLYVDAGEVASYEFQPSYIKRRLEYWQAEGEKLMEERQFLATPSYDACRWCGFRSDKGGPCKAWKVLGRL